MACMGEEPYVQEAYVRQLSGQFHAAQTLFQKTLLKNSQHHVARMELALQTIVLAPQEVSPETLKSGLGKATAIRTYSTYLFRIGRAIRATG